MATKEKPTGLRKLLEDLLADIYYAEKQLVKALPKMAKAANDGKLAQAITAHHKETEGQVARLEQVFASMDMPAKGKKCPAIDGLLDEAKEIMDEFKDDAALDAGIVAAGQKVEHYEIASYGTMATWAKQLGLDKAAQLLNETLEQEKGADEKLSEIAEDVVNIEAEEGTDAKRGMKGVKMTKGMKPAPQAKKTSGKAMAMHARPAAKKG